MRTVRFLIAGHIEEEPGVTNVDVPFAEAIAVLESLGLGTSDFGAVDAKTLAPLCRRRLWPARAPRPTLRTWVERLLALAELAGNGIILFS